MTHPFAQGMCSRMLILKLLYAPKEFIFIYFLYLLYLSSPIDRWWLLNLLAIVGDILCHIFIKERIFSMQIMFRPFMKITDQYIWCNNLNTAPTQSFEYWVRYTEQSETLLAWKCGGGRSFWLCRQQWLETSLHTVTST